MRYAMDLIVGMLGYLLAMLVVELVKGWWFKPRSTFAEVQAELMKDMKRPRQQYSVAEILAAARKQQRRQGT